MNNKQYYQKVFQDNVDLLNKDQKSAVETIDGPVAVVAGPGTGKTQILTLRIANIMNHMGSDMAENILALTFTNAGVYAMKERLSDFVGIELAYKTGIYTFHSFAETQIKENTDIFTQFTFSRPITDIEKIQIIEDILDEGSWKHLQTFASDFHYTKKIISAIDDLKSEAISPEDLEISLHSIEKRLLEKEGESAFYKIDRGGNKKGDLKKTVSDKIYKQKGKQKELLEIYEKYQQKLKEKKLYDFSDTILSVVKEAENNQSFREILQEKYLYILVDEHQDTNSAQNKLIEIIGAAEVNENKPNIFTVGDQKQAIYRFQGASVEEFEKFRTQYTDVKIITLINNYRSSQNILNSAHALISTEKNLLAKHPEIKKEQSRVLVTEHIDYKSELISLSEKIQSEIEKGVPPNEIAVFYKENRNLSDIKNILEKRNIPYTVKSKENILDSSEIKKLLLLLRSTSNMINDEVLAKTLFIDFLGFEAHDVLKILERLSQRKGIQIKNKSIYKIITSEKVLEDLEVSDVQKYLDFGKFIQKQKKLSQELDFLEFFSQFISKSGFLKHILQSHQNTVALARLEKIFDQVKEQFYTKKNYTLENFLDYIFILDKYEIAVFLGEGDFSEGVQLMTAHGSKGLEFESVYITNVIDNK
jgi:DNA helicase-2/ATP-dependent DNA helicase PcrA